MATRKHSKPKLAPTSLPKFDYPNLTPSNAEEVERALRHLTVALWMCADSGKRAFDDLAGRDQQDYLLMCADLAAKARDRAVHMMKVGEETANG